ncbi:HigA family addiction module antitoxin [Aerococcus urinaeequi]|uniref:HigA family addiction module antitoxin n=1 Tax=Aerococcus urinaeequi TaxID=51665 RepID=UPI003D6A8382
MSNEVIYEDLIAFHPGSYVEDIVDDLNITQTEFAERLGTSPKSISKIINGEEGISKDMANKLSKLTGISNKTWLNLQTEYDLKVMEIEENKREDEKVVCKLIDFSYFKKVNLVENKNYSLKDKIQELRKLLNISNLSFLNDFNSSVSYRNTKAFEAKSIVNSNVLLEIATNIARNKSEKSLDTKRLEKYFPEIKKMTLQNPEVFYPRLEEILLECGIVLVGLPHLKNANLQGATKKFKNGSVLLLITDRKKDADIFWFSLVHELGHIYNKDFYSNYEDEDLYSKKESEADKFSQDFLIDPDIYNRFISESDINRSTILKLAEELEINPSILVGRLQNDKLLDYHKYYDLKTKYSFSFSS